VEGEFCELRDEGFCEVRRMAKKLAHLGDASGPPGPVRC
jgi:hypothetical protein